MTNPLRQRDRNPFDRPLICAPPHHFVDPPPNWNIVPVSAPDFNPITLQRQIVVASLPTDSRYPIGYLLQVYNPRFGSGTGLTSPNGQVTNVPVLQADVETFMQINLADGPRIIATWYLRPPHHQF